MQASGSFASAAFNQPATPWRAASSLVLQDQALLGQRRVTDHLHTSVEVASALEAKRQVEVREAELKVQLSASEEKGQVLDRRLRTKTTECQELQRNLASSNSTCQDLIAHHKVHQGRLQAAQWGLEVEQRRSTLLKGKLEVSEQQLKRSEQRGRALQQELLDSRRVGEAAERASNNERLALLQRIQVLEGSEAEGAARFNTTQQQLTGTLDELKRMQQQLANAEKQLQLVSTQRQGWETDARRLGKGLTKLNAMYEEAKGQLEASQQSNAALRSQLEGTTKELAQLQQSHKAMITSTRQEVAAAGRMLLDKAAAAKEEAAARRDQQLGAMQEQLRQMSKQLANVMHATSQQQKPLAGHKTSSSDCLNLRAQLTGLEAWQNNAQRCITALLPQIAPNLQQQLRHLCA